MVKSDKQPLISKKILIPPAVAERAIYVDFEGEGKNVANKIAPPPLFGGILVDGEYTLTALGEGHVVQVLSGAEHIDNNLSIREFCRSINSLAKREKRKIIYFSSRESKVFEEYGAKMKDGIDFRTIAKEQTKVSTIVKDIFSEFKKSNKDKKDKTLSKSAKAAARRYSNLGLLHHLAIQCGYKYPKNRPAGLVGHWTRRIEQQAQNKSRYTQFPNGAKKCLGKMKTHNKDDLLSLQYCCFKLGDLK